MASRIYGCDEADVTKDQRFVGKTTILGAGYGMGAVKFQAQLKNFGFEVELDEARRIINIYRESNWKINHLWRNCQNMIRAMVNGDSMQVGKAGVLEVLGSERAVRLPSGLLLRYNDLSAEQTENGLEYSYKTRRGRTRIYGGKVTEEPVPSGSALHKLVSRCYKSARDTALC